MVLFESIIAFNIIAFILIFIKRNKILVKFKKITIFDKIFISGLLILSLFSTVISVFFVFRIPSNPFAFILMEILSILLSIFHPFMSLVFLGVAAIKWYFPNYKSTEPKVKTKKFEDKTLIALLRSYKVPGSGEVADPYIIENSEIFPEVDVIKIKKSNSYIILRNHDLGSIRIKKSSNIAIENCNYSSLVLYNCSEVKITDCTFKLLEINKSVKILIQNTEISYLKLFRSFLNEFKNSSIKRMDKQHSPDNVFNIKETLEDKGRKSNVFQNNVPSILLLFLAFLVVGDVLFFSLLTNTANLYTFLIIPIVLASITSFIVISAKEAIELQKNYKKYYPGKTSLRFNNGRLVLGCTLIIVGLFLINMVLYVLYIDPLLWIQIETTTIFILSVIAIVSVIMTIGINTILRNMNSFSERFVRTKNPIYPLFFLYNLFFALLLILLYITTLIFRLNDAFLIFAQSQLVLILMSLVISVVTKLRLSKLTQSHWVTRFIYGIFLVGLGGFTYPLLDYLLPVHVRYYGLLNFPLEASFFFSIIISSFILVLVGIFSFSKTTKLISGVHYRQKEKYAKSIKSFRSALRTEPSNEDGLYNLGLTYYKNEEYTKSAETLKKTLNINPNSILALIGLAYASAEIEDFDIAIDACEKTIHLIKNPVVSVATKLTDIIKQSFSQPIKEEIAWFTLSNVYSLSKNYNKAIEAAKKALDLNPKYIEAIIALAYGHHKLDEFDKAIEACNSALELDSTFAHAWNRLGLIYQSKGDLELGIQMLEKAVDLSPKEHRIKLNLAKIYLESKNYGQALKTISSSLGLKPHYQDAIDLREQILSLINKDTKE